ncbi:glycosyltransferase [Antrihabitans sp. YC2-6]|uniref:glycosyltransferase n=1 Tax=Antrihabitans sp. YC2-6 TaxID=2799498 RepID=UPI0018F75EEC|nr:glycosyltransferase [Antrihabitans sp. YC2-6]MBJ8344928.1 glycosyltransferase [Antrihabitans sp. YC2-6]
MGDRIHSVSVVVPVYRGETTIANLVSEFDKYAGPTETPKGSWFTVDEIVLVHDNGPDRSDVVLAELAESKDRVEVVWLSRNYGQDAATIAGMAASRGDWIATLDEDGQHDPAFIGHFLDSALAQRADLVYSKPTNSPPHGFVRNITSRGAKLVLSTLFQFPAVTQFESYRLIRGDIGRKLAQVAAAGVYLDIALTWVVGRTATAPIELRTEGRPVSGYTYRRLFSLFWKMVLCSGTRGLRIVSVLGIALALAGGILAAVVIVKALTGEGDPEGWASTIVAILLCSGSILFSLGLIAEYLGVALHVLAGRPLFLTVDSPTPRPDGEDE